MSTARTISIRPRAAANLAQIATHIARAASVRSAVSWRQRIEAVIRALATDADQWAEADEAADLGINLRCRLFGRAKRVPHPVHRRWRHGQRPPHS